MYNIFNECMLINNKIVFYMLYQCFKHSTTKKNSMEYHL